MRQIAIYVGRFQPFHKGHYSAYKHLVDKFGEDNVYVGTSDVPTDEKNPFSFQDKQHIMKALFNIPSERVVQVKNPYSPVEILNKFDPEKTVFVTAVGEKDGKRLDRGKYFKKYSDTGVPLPYKDRGYFVTVPNFTFDGEVMSASKIRDNLSNPSIPIEDKIDFFKGIYGKFDPKIFNFVQKQIQGAQKAPEEEPTTPDTPSPEEKPTRNPRDRSILMKKVRNPQTRRDILVKTALNYDKNHPVYKLAKKMFQRGTTNEIFEAVLVENAIINQYNSLVDQFITGEDQKAECRIDPTDTQEEIERKCKNAYKRGVFYYPLLYSLQSANQETDGGPIDQPQSNPTEQQFSNEAMSSTERVRKYYKRHPEKVRKYLKKTQNDRVARNRDRAKAVKKHGESKMKNHDVHHPDGPNGGSWRLAKKDHGRDKVNEGLDFLVEGGAAGHMAHPYEDLDLTFGQYKDIISKGLIGDLGGEGPVTEKLDGQNIAFTVIDGDVRFARNKGHVKHSGQNSMTINDIIHKFEGRGDLQKAFVGAAQDLERTIRSLPKEKVDEMFKNGKSYMSTEIILPDTQNVIPYGKSVLVFHGTIEYDDAGNKVSTDPENAKIFDNYVKKFNQHKQKVFGLQGPNVISFNDTDTEELEQKTNTYHSAIDSLRNKYGLSDEDTVREYYTKWWTDEIKSELRQAGIKSNPNTVKALINRFAFGDKSIKLTDIKDPTLRLWVSEYEKTKLPSVQKKVREPFEMLFLKVGADSLTRIKNFLGSNNPDAIKSLQVELDKVKSMLRGGDLGDITDKLEQEFERLNQIGIDRLVPSEGVVFIYNGKPYKFTGAFAPINQILGTFKFSDVGQRQKDKPTEPSTSTPTTDEPDQTNKEFIKQFYGDKIKNPLTGADITIKSALSYDKDHPAYKSATQYLKSKIKQ